MGLVRLFFSAKDTSEGGLLHSDRDAHGGVPLLPWYLQQLADHEKRTGVRVLDLVDVHFYPQAPGVYGGGERTDSEGAALRIRSTRSFWDPSYRDESWIKEHVNLIPRLKDWIAKNYPGRGISIGEWSFGGEDHISGALAIAESLGRFGPAGSHLCILLGQASQPRAAGFMHFVRSATSTARGGDSWTCRFPPRHRTTSPSFASTDASATHVVAVVLNLDPVFASQADIDVTSCGQVTQEKVFRYGSDVSALTAETGKSSGTVLHELIAPYSIKVLDLTLQKQH